MGFVNHEQRGLGELFRGDEDEFQVARFQFRERFFLFSGMSVAVYQRGAPGLMCLESIHLIFLQRDQRGDDHGWPGRRDSDPNVSFAAAVICSLLRFTQVTCAQIARRVPR